MNRLARFYRHGWGRLAALAALIVVLALQIDAGTIFDAPRMALFDLYQRARKGFDHSSSVAIVGIDDASLAARGQWPWSRQLDAQLVAKILEGHPAALGIDLLWSEPDRQSPEQWLKQAGELTPAISDALKQLPTNDDQLKTVLAKGPVVLGVVAVDSDNGTKDHGSFAPVRRFGSTDPSTVLPNFPTALRSLSDLDHATRGHGLLSVTPDPDGVFRRMPLISVVSGVLAPSFGLEALRLASKPPAIALYLGDHGVDSVVVGRLKVPTQADGSVWVNFSPHDDRRFVSAEDVLSGSVPADFFDGKLILIGMTASAQEDLRMTPLGLMHGTEVHAQLLENILEGRLARRPNWAGFAEPGATFVLAVLLIAVLPMLRSRWKAPVAVLPLILLAAIGFELWHQRLLLVDVATPAIGQALVLLAFLGGSFAEADVQRRRLRRELEVRKLAAAKAEGELEAGRRIQMGILPTAASVAGDPRFDLAAVIVPARQIGGDLYDFFKIDDDHLFVTVGDVSGKGVPAALFMALGKSLCKSAALRGETDIGEIVNRANAEISRDNTEMLFITLFAGILDLQTGELNFCNAGHDAPILLSDGHKPQAIDGVGGPPLCIMEDYPYMTETRQLLPGDLICITTDGITEAMTEAGALMGRERAETALAEMPADASAAAVTDGLHKAVDAFVAGAEPSDDLTILTVRWLGPQVVTS